MDADFDHPEALVIGAEQELGAEKSTPGGRLDRVDHLLANQLEGAVNVVDAKAKEHADDVVVGPGDEEAVGGGGTPEPVPSDDVGARQGGAGDTQLIQGDLGGSRGGESHLSST